LGASAFGADGVEEAFEAVVIGDEFDGLLLGEDSGGLESAAEFDEGVDIGVVEEGGEAGQGF
jgi:hypothetical protein